MIATGTRERRVGRRKENSQVGTSLTLDHHHRVVTPLLCQYDPQAIFWSHPMKTTAWTFALVAALGLLVLLYSSRADEPKAGPYQVTKTLKIGGEGGWD